MELGWSWGPQTLQLVSEVSMVLEMIPNSHTWELGYAGNSTGQKEVPGSISTLFCPRQSGDPMHRAWISCTWTPSWHHPSRTNMTNGRPPSAPGPWAGDPVQTPLTKDTTLPSQVPIMGQSRGQLTHPGAQEHLCLYILSPLVLGNVSTWTKAPKTGYAGLVA